MDPYAMDDSALRRENRRVALGRRLLSHGVRTKIISRAPDGRLVIDLVGYQKWVEGR